MYPSWKTFDISLLTTVPKPTYPSLPPPQAPTFHTVVNSLPGSVSIPVASPIIPSLSPLGIGSVDTISGVKRDRETALVIPSVPIVESMTMVSNTAAIAATTTVPTTSNVSLVDLHQCYDEAWKILTTPSNASNIETLNTLMNDLGLTDKEMISFCEREDIETLTKGLKVLLGRKLMKLFDKWKLIQEQLS